MEGRLDRQRPRRQELGRIAVIGAGRAARALAPALATAGASVVAVASRSVESARTLAAQFPQCQVVDVAAIA
ncbi:MAG: NAD(P)-binding domain-containing protein, partial [Dehalococcoidia bacterium]|nr:NAD(P)-binding domain-containing protein [Dehalococcoidia bacterium]